MEFVNVSEIIIPEGSVQKITETSTGRVIWEKGKTLDAAKASWRIVHTGILATNHYPFVMTSLVKRYPLNSAKSGDGKNYLPFLTTTFANYEKKTTGKIGEDTSCYTTNPTINQPDNNISSYIIPRASAGNDPHDRYTIAASDYVASGYDGNTISYGGLALEYFGGSQNTYRFVRYGSDFALNIDAIPRSEAGVNITYSKERGEFLVTGLNKGSCIVPKDFTSNTILSYDNNNLTRSCWVSEMNKYFSATGTDRNVRYSSDGKTWNTVAAFTSGNVLGVEYLDGDGRLCAISSTTGKISLSRDGLTWEEKTAPFSNALAYEYDDENKVLVVVNKNGAYATRDFTKWITIPLPSGVTVNFREIVYGFGGIFACYEYFRRQIFFLSLFNPLELSSDIPDISAYPQKIMSDFPY